MQNPNPINHKLNKRNDSFDMLSDEYDSDSKENEQVSLEN
jgi:hypothetical protein